MKIAFALALFLVLTVASARTCKTDCWTDQQGQQHCITYCN